MKTIGILGVVVTASLALLQPAQGGSRGSGHTFSAGPHHSASTGHYYSSRSRYYSGGSARYYRSSTRFSSQAAFRNRAYSPSGPLRSINRTNALNPRAFSGSGPRFTANRSAALRSQGFSSQGHVLAASSRNWDRGRDHFWHGHRCHWRNNAWVIFDFGFYPWGYPYGYYPGAYSYYDGDYYDDGSASSEYSQEPQSDYDGGNPDSILSQAQAALAKEGYYRGAIDGSLGPGTRNALRRYQQSHGLAVTGRLDRPVLEALGLR